MTLLIFEFFFFFILCFVMMVQQPLGMGGFLLLVAFLVSVYISTFFSSWFSMSLFLIYIGGMLVLFGYVVVLIPNFVFSAKGYFLSFFSLFFFFFFSDFGEVSLFVLDFSFSFFSFLNFYVYLGLGLVLFVGLVSVSKICFFQMGSLRPFFFDS
uniref:NADH dehydrogenase subunit 6 n=1 Tax=Nipponnemertes punctatula TaxID=1332184 RepID=X2C438_9BILA|nr:NADH dehydrogenase subunit 6 [Nipponnemertes punctatula]AGL46762.1 NADH dehydrogenase subunit 6 [Nipponnemertes punctatula]